MGLRSRQADGRSGGPVRLSGGGAAGPADRLAVGVSALTKPDSFHAGSCDSEREDQRRLGAFDVQSGAGV